MINSNLINRGQESRSSSRKNDVIFYESFYMALKELPDSDRLAAYDAICKYGCTGEEPEVSGIVKIIFTLVKPQIDANERRAASGKKGGRPRKAPDEISDAISTVLENESSEHSDRGGKPENESEETHDHEEDCTEARCEPPPTKKTARKKGEEPRHRYGRNGKVMLSDKELEKLKSEFPTDWEEWIERVDGYCQQMGKTYSDYLQTIRNWAKKDKEQGRHTSKTSGYKNRFHNFTPSDTDYSIFDSVI